MLSYKWKINPSNAFLIPTNVSDDSFANASFFFFLLFPHLFKDLKIFPCLFIQCLLSSKIFRSFSTSIFFLFIFYPFFFQQLFSIMSFSHSHFSLFFSLFISIFLLRFSLFFVLSVFFFLLSFLNLSFFPSFCFSHASQHGDFRWSELPTQSVFLSSDTCDLQRQSPCVKERKEEKTITVYATEARPSCHKLKVFFLLFLCHGAPWVLSRKTGVGPLNAQTTNQKWRLGVYTNAVGLFITEGNSFSEKCQKMAVCVRWVSVIVL